MRPERGIGPRSLFHGDLMKIEKPHEARAGSLDNAYDAAVVLRYMAPVGHTIDDCRRPDYWRNVAKEAGQQRIAGKHAWNRIEIIAEDGTWEAELRVLSVADGLVHTRTLRTWSADAKKDPAAPEGYVLEHIQSNGWRALDPGGLVVAEKKTTRDAALNAALDHHRKAKGGR